MGFCQELAVLVFETAKECGGGAELWAGWAEKVCLSQLFTTLPSTFPQLCCLPVGCKSVSPVPQGYPWLQYTNRFEPLAVSPGTTLHEMCCRKQLLAAVAQISEGSEGNQQKMC